MQLVAAAQHRPFKKKFIDPVRIFERLAQAAAGRNIKHQRAGAVIHVQIDKGDAPVFLVGKMPGQIGRNRAGPDAAAGADDRDDLPLFLAERRARCGLADTEQVIDRGLRQGLGQGLDNIIADTGVDEVAIETDVVAVADHDDGHARLTHLGQMMNLADRKFHAGDVDHQRNR